jgi:hypothetical protein
MLSRLQKIMCIISLGVALVLFSGASSFAAIEFNVEAIEAEIAAAVAAGEEPVLAAKTAVANAVKAILAENPDYPGGIEALQLDILDALAGLNITGLDLADVLLAGNHALGITIDPAIEAYEAATTPGAQGRARARTQGGNAYGPGGKPANGSPT